MPHNTGWVPPQKNWEFHFPHKNMEYAEKESPTGNLSEMLVPIHCFFGGHNPLAIFIFTLIRQQMSGPQQTPYATRGEESFLPEKQNGLRQTNG